MTKAPTDFCTYFDSRYLSRGLALYESLRRHAKGSTLHVLCMDNVAFDALVALALPGLVPIRRSDFEAGDDDLRAASANRSPIEYYFTCTPSLPLYVLRRNPDLERVLYVDADFFFFSDVKAILDEWGEGSIYIVGHRFPEHLRWHEKYGKFNVGILGFRNDPSGRRCLETWRRQCNAWCYDRLEDGKFADQKYLESWPGDFPGVVQSSHLGVNLAPWNRPGCQLGFKDGVPWVDYDPVVCYHFHGLKLFPLGFVEPLADNYGSKLDSRWIRWIYEPYLKELRQGIRIARMGTRGDLRDQWPLSLRQLTARGRNAQILMPLGRHWREIPPQLMMALEIVHRGTARLRKLFRSAPNRTKQLSET